MVFGLYAFDGAAGVRLSGGFRVSCAAVQDAPAVVLGVGVAESLAFDGFDDPVCAFGGPVGEPAAEVGQQLGFPGAQGAREAVRLGDVVCPGSRFLLSFRRVRFECSVV